MARRTRNRVNIWPGFVDALTTLVMVVIFVLVVFIFAQQFLSTQLNDNVSQIKSLLNENEQLEFEKFELKELTGKFSLDALATCAFGLDFDSFGGESSNAFVEHAADVFKQDIWSFVLMLKFIPGVSRLFEVFNIMLVVSCITYRSLEAGD